jgi:hypothetical protein
MMMFHTNCLANSFKSVVIGTGDAFLMTERIISKCNDVCALSRVSTTRLSILLPDRKTIA